MQVRGGGGSELSDAEYKTNACQEGVELAQSQCLDGCTMDVERIGTIRPWCARFDGDTHAC